jgi:asparagine synthase (glutamine-hydrolysing)
MCGIFGLYSKKISKKNKLEIAKLAISSLNHRGPDDKGMILLNQNTIFCHTRLSIIDISTGRQPMEGDNGNYIVFNGEIVNYKKLKKQLIDDGYFFKTISDTEVILKLYEKYGVNLLKFIKGMFAFAIWDSKKNEIFLARDHTGIKPMYYIQKKEEFYFSSELLALKNIFKSNNSNLLTNEKLFNEYLIFGNFPLKNTLYKDVFSLPPGHYIKIKDGQITEKKKYWDYVSSLNNYKSINYSSENEVIENLSNVIENVFSEWSVSDVPISILLSSGLDSNLLNKILEKNRNIEKYCVIFPDNQEIINEKKILKKVLKLEIKESNTIEVFDRDIPDNLEKLTNHMSHPLQNFNSLTMVKICEHIKKHSASKVLFTGDGADELFGGYKKHLDIKENFLKSNNPLTMILGKNYLTIDRMKMFEKENFNEKFDERMEIFNGLKNKEKSNHILEFDQKSFLPGYLDRADKIGMMFSQEIRVPFCDDRIVSIANNIPWNMKINETSFKYILKKVAEKYLPKNLIWSKTKYKFNLPIYNSFYNGKLNEMYRDLINKNSKISKFYNFKGLINLINLHKNEHETINDHSNTLSRILSLEIWLREQ